MSSLNLEGVNIKELYTKLSRNKNLPKSWACSNKSITTTKVHILKKDPVNTNSVFAQFRSDMEKSRDVIITELEKSKKLREKYNNINQLKFNKFRISENNENIQSMFSTKNDEFFKTKSNLTYYKSSKNFNKVTKENANVFKTAINMDYSSDELKESAIKNNNKNKSSSIPQKALNKAESMKQMLSNKKNIFNVVNQVPRKPDYKRVNNFLGMSDKNQTNSSSMNLKKPMTRIKSFKVIYDPNWYEKTKMPMPPMATNIISNIDFQSNIISDELKVLLENIQFYKMSYLSNPYLLDIFQIIEKGKQIKMNQIIEESCGLILEISVGVIGDFAQYLEKFVSVQPPRPEKLATKLVKNELKTFLNNINLFNEITLFLKSSYDVYLILIKQVDDMALPYNEFLKIHQFLARCRLNMSTLIFSIKNYMKNYSVDQKIMNKYEKNKLPDSRENQHLLNSEKQTNLKTSKPDIVDKIRNQFQFKINEYNERNRRLNNVLTKKGEVKDDSFELKKKELAKKFNKNIGLNSKMIDKLLKYCPKDLKNQIMSERIISRHKEKNGDSD